MNKSNLKKNLYNSKGYFETFNEHLRWLRFLSPENPTIWKIKKKEIKNNKFIIEKNGNTFKTPVYCDFNLGKQIKEFLSTKNKK